MRTTTNTTVGALEALFQQWKTKIKRSDLPVYNAVSYDDIVLREGTACVPPEAPAPVPFVCLPLNVHQLADFQGEVWGSGLSHVIVYG